MRLPLTFVLAFTFASPAWADPQRSELLAPYPAADQAPAQPLEPYPSAPPRAPAPPPQYYYPPPYYGYPPPYYYPQPPPYYYPQPPPYYYPPPQYYARSVAVAAPRRDASRRLIRLDAGYSYRYAFRDSIHAAALELNVGAEHPRSAGSGRLSLELGQTRAGLSFQAVELGGGFEWRLGKRVRLGFAPVLEFLIFERATRANADLWTVALGLRTDLTVDLWQRPRGGALFVGARIGYDLMLAADEHYGFSGRLRLGWRF
jgi:hypothetical protein